MSVRSGRFMLTKIGVLLFIALAPLLTAAPARITFERILPASHNLGVEEAAIVHALGDHDKVELFVEVLVNEASQSGLLRMRDARRATAGRAAEAQLEVKAFTCGATVREGEVGSRDVDNKRVRRKQMWVDAICTARIDVMTRTLKRPSTFTVKGEGTSPRVAEVGADEREIALAQAAKYAAIAAAERITPRRVRESIALDETAPAFEEGVAMIDSGRLAEARAIWVAALRTNMRSAALRYNLGALCEALGDRRAAEQHYLAARELAPNESRYALELKLFLKRMP